MDEDKDRALTFVEFHGLLIWLGVNLKLDQIQKLAMSADVDQDGKIQYHELEKRMQELMYKEKFKYVPNQLASTSFSS